MPGIGRPVFPPIALVTVGGNTGYRRNTKPRAELPRIRRVFPPSASELPERPELAPSLETSDPGQRIGKFGRCPVAPAAPEFRACVGISLRAQFVDFSN